MNGLDIAMTAIMTLCLVYGAWKGFIRDAFSLVGLAGGFFVASRFYPEASDFIKTWISSPRIAMILGWILIFFLCWFSVRMLSTMLRESMRVLRLGWMDKVAGLGFGFIKGVLICAGLLVVLSMFFPTDSPILTRSRLSPYINEITREMGKWIPGGLGDKFRKTTPMKNKAVPGGL